MGIHRNFSRGGNVNIYLFQVADVEMQMDVQNALLFLHHKKCPTKERAPFAFNLKSFSNRAVYEFATKL